MRLRPEVAQAVLVASGAALPTHDETLRIGIFVMRKNGLLDAANYLSEMLHQSERGWELSAAFRGIQKTRAR